RTSPRRMERLRLDDRRRARLDERLPDARGGARRAPWRARARDAARRHRRVARTDRSGRGDLMDGYIACPTHPLQVYCRDRFDLRYAEAATLAGLVAAARVGVDWLTLEELGVAVAR